MKIALLTDGIYPYVLGGMQKHSYYLAKYLAREGVRVDLYHFIPEEESAEALERVFSADELSKIDVIKLTFPKLKPYPGHYIYSNYLYSKQVYKELIKRKPVDFIYAKGFSAWFLLHAKENGERLPPVGVNFHGLEMFQRAPSFKVLLQLYILRLPTLYNLHRADYAFSYGGKISEILIRQNIAPQNIIEIPTGIGSQWLSHLPNLNSSAERNFVFMGRYERRKGIEEINEVLGQLLSGHNFKVHFIGPIPANKKIPSEKVVYWGAVNEQEKIQAILSKCDIMLCPSHSEGMPNVIMEGMASGLAIIATDVGAINTMVSDKNGWLIPGADKQALSQAIIDAMYCDKQQLNSKKEASVKQVSENYTWDAVIKITIDKISSIVTL